MISYGKQTMDQDDIDSVVDVLKGDWLTQGPAVEIFESDLKNYFGANHAFYRTFNITSINNIAVS